MDQRLYNYKARIVKVYDGDTVTASIALGFHHTMERQKLRLKGIDTPELRGEERPKGLIARDRLAELILDKDVIIESYRDKSGKYGRWIATIHLDVDGEWVNVNELLVAEGLAELYD